MSGRVEISVIPDRLGGQADLNCWTACFNLLGTPFMLGSGPTLELALAQLAENLASALADALDLNTRLEQGLATAYADGLYVEVAKICDELVDPSGALLGRIRFLSASPA